MPSKMYQRLISRPFYVCLKILSIACCVPGKGESKIRFLSRFVMMRLCSIIIWTDVLIHIVVTMKNKTGVNLTEDFAIILSWTGFIVSSILFALFHPAWLKLCEEIANFELFGEPPAFQRTQRQGNLFVAIMTAYSVSSLTCHGASAISRTAGCEEFNEQHGTHEICIVFVPMWLPFDAVSTAVARVLSLFQYVVINIMFASIIAVVFMVCDSANLIATHIDNLKRKLPSVIEESDSAEQRRKLRLWVEYHQHILRMGRSLGYLTEKCFSHFGFTFPVCMGFIGRAILVEKSLRMVLFFVGFCVSIFLLCHYGQILFDATESVKEALYSSKWYSCDPKFAKDLQFIMLRCQTPLELEVIFLGSFRYALYLLILRTTYSYITLLNQVS